MKNTLIFLIIILSTSLYAQEVIIDSSVDSSQYNKTILTNIPYKFLSEVSKDFINSLFKIIYTGEQTKDDISNDKLTQVDYINIGRAFGSNVFVVNNNSYKHFTFGSYPKMNKSEVISLVESTKAKLRGISEIDIRQYSVDRAAIRGINENGIEEERDHFYKVCYKQFINNVPVGLKDGELCFFVFPDMKIWSIRSTLIKPIGAGEEVRISDPINVIKEYILENQKGCDKIYLGDYKMFYKSYDNLLIPVHTFSSACYSDNKVVKSDIIITPAFIK